MIEGMQRDGIAANDCNIIFTEYTPWIDFIPQYRIFQVFIMFFSFYVAVYYLTDLPYATITLYTLAVLTLPLQDDMKSSCLLINGWR